MKTVIKKHVIVGMSGGVDSSVAALLLLEQGYHVEGLFMKNWEEDDDTKYCTARQDLADAEAVCQTLGIKLHKANFAAEYWDNVFEHFLSEYRNHRTPNPDILCNREIKFKVFADYAAELGAQFIATGHYAQLRKENDQIQLLKAADSNKDQTYFLHAVHKSQLYNALFPLGALQKRAVRDIAKKNNLATYAKKDSTGICFIGERRFADFLKKYLPAQPGPIKSLQNEILGEHQGLIYYTIGQRQGLRIGGLQNAGHEPWYVIDKDVQNNTLLVAQGNNHPRLFSSSLTVKNISWISGKAPTNTWPLALTAKIRYRQLDQSCTLDEDPEGYQVYFSQPQRAITPGQYVVFYLDNICLGGGVIEKYT